MTIHKTVLIYIIIMALTTYVIRMAPFVLFRRKLKSRFARSFVFYVPYTVLSAMTFPAVLYSTSSFVSAAAGSLVAILLAYTKRSLLTVAVCAAFTAFIMQIIM